MLEKRMLENQASFHASSADRRARTHPYTVVAASDFSPLGDRAVIEALRLCAPHRGASLHVITIGTDGPSGILMPGERRFVSQEEAHEAARARLSQTVDEFMIFEQPLELEKVAYYVSVGAPAERIVTLARVVDADLIVLGTHGRHGLERMIMGSVAHEVLQTAPCGVFVIRPRDFLEGEKLPDIQPPLEPGQHSLLPPRIQPTYHYVHRLSRDTTPIMP